MPAQQVNKTKRKVSYQVRLSRDCEREVMKLEVEICSVQLSILVSLLVSCTGCCRFARDGVVRWECLGSRELSHACSLYRGVRQVPKSFGRDSISVVEFVPGCT